MNVYGLQKKADISMCTVQAEKLFTIHNGRNTQVVSMCLKNQIFGFL